MKELLTALVAAKNGFAPVRKDKTNPFHKSKYASLDSVLAAVEPSLTANGLVLSHSITDGMLTTRLYHTSGDCLESGFALPELSDPQKLGSIISYYRRYAVCGLLSVTADEDDDAQSNSGNNAPARSQGQSHPKPPAASIPAAKPPAPEYSPEIKEQQQALSECMEILEWDKNTKLAWTKTISNKPMGEWPIDLWKSAVSRALSEIDLMNSTDPSNGGI